MKRKTIPITKFFNKDSSVILGYMSFDENQLKQYKLTNYHFEPGLRKNKDGTYELLEISLVRNKPNTNKRSLSKIGSKNPAWKGDSVKYGSLHDWVRSKKKKPSRCQDCSKKKKVELANISGKYKRDLSDWEYICRKCHMDKDGRSEQLRQSGKSRKLPDKTCPICKTIFHTDKREQINCSKSCGGFTAWEKRRKEI